MRLKINAGYIWLIVSGAFTVGGTVLALKPLIAGSDAATGRDVALCALVAGLSAGVAAYILDRRASVEIATAKAETEAARLATAEAQQKILELDEQLSQTKLSYEELRKANLEMEARIAPRGVSQEDLNSLWYDLKGVVSQVEMGCIVDPEANNYRVRLNMALLQIGVSVGPLSCPSPPWMVMPMLPGIFVIRGQGNSTVLEEALKKISNAVVSFDNGTYGFSSSVPIIYISSKPDETMFKLPLTFAG